MNYKGFVITPCYMVGSDFTITKEGKLVDRKPTPKDVEYYEVFDPMEEGNRLCADFTVADCKQSIDDVLKIMGMVSNLQKEWDKLAKQKV